MAARAPRAPASAGRLPARVGCQRIDQHRRLRPPLADCEPIQEVVHAGGQRGREQLRRIRVCWSTRTALRLHRRDASTFHLCLILRHSGCVFHIGKMP